MFKIQYIYDCILNVNHFLYGILCKLSFECVPTANKTHLRFDAYSEGKIHTADIMMLINKYPMRQQSKNRLVHNTMTTIKRTLMPPRIDRIVRTKLRTQICKCQSQQNQDSNCLCEMPWHFGTDRGQSAFLLTARRVDFTKEKERRKLTSKSEPKIIKTEQLKLGRHTPTVHSVLYSRWQFSRSRYQQRRTIGGLQRTQFENRKAPSITQKGKMTNATGRRLSVRFQFRRKPIEQQC